MRGWETTMTCLAISFGMTMHATRIFVPVRDSA